MAAGYFLPRASLLSKLSPLVRCQICVGCMLSLRRCDCILLQEPCLRTLAYRAVVGTRSIEVRSPHAVQLQFEIIRRIKTLPIFDQALEMFTDNLAFDKMMERRLRKCPDFGSEFRCRIRSWLFS